MKKSEWKAKLVKSLKISLAAAASILIATRLQLDFAATAGIITVLSIGNTKKETVKTAARRALAYLLAVILAAGCFYCAGFTIAGFTLYLFLFALICLALGLSEAIAMDSVLITHFLSAKSMAPALLMNETLLFFIGTGMGILVNLYLHKNEKGFERMSCEVDEQIRGILQRMSLWILKSDRSEYGSGCFEKLEESIDLARACAVANLNNSLFFGSLRELEYIEMRQQQGMVLQGIYRNIKALDYLPKQAVQVAELFGKIEREYHRNNTVKELLKELEQVFTDMKKQPLPKSREEFEARAILFYILMQTKRFLELKRAYAKEWEG